MIERKTWWPVTIVAILAATVGVNAWIYWVANQDQGIGIEPDYYKKAVAWDSTLEQSRRNLALGWHVQPTLAAFTPQSGADLRVTVADSTGAMIPDATVRVYAFFNARAGDAVDSTLVPHAGIYETHLPVHHGGEVLSGARRGSPGRGLVTLFAGVLLASLVGSVHCAAMCGAFVCAYAGVGAPSATGRGLAWPAHAAYHAGRLVSYLTLGLAAGAIGARVDDLGRLAGLARGATVLAGMLMVMWAVGTIAVAVGARIGPAPFAPGWLQRRLGALIAALRDEPPVARAALTGLLTTLLPCGWLYTFVVTAGGTGNAVAGAATMLAFWVGTVPALLAVGAGARRLLGPLAHRLPVAAATLVLALGLLSIAGRVHAPSIHTGHAMHMATIPPAGAATP
jgi:sulfite exporter TauE/SafE